jgi:hypothetical protein
MLTFLHCFRHFRRCGMSLATATHRAAYVAAKGF